eukprot:680816-Hanusia_phi.AAC.3
MSGWLVLVLVLLCQALVGSASSDAGECLVDGREDEACILARLDTEDDVRSAFDAGPVRYNVVPNFLSSRIPEYPRDVTLVTQGSLDRLSRLKEQALSWKGSLSVAIYFRHHETQGENFARNLQALRELHSEIEELGSCRLRISLLYAVDPETADKEYDTL